MECEKVIDLLPEYVLGQTSAEQEAGMREHFSNCASCSTQLASLVSASVQLGEAVRQANPPSRLKDTLMARVVASTAPNNKFKAQPKRSLATIFGVIGPAFALVVGALGVQSVRLLRQTATVQQESARLRAAVIEISQNPRSVVLSATVDGGKSSGWMKFNPAAQTAVLTVADMPPLPASEAYQLWLVLPDGSRDNAGVLYTPVSTGEQRLFVISAPKPFSAYVRCGFSREPVAGSPVPTGPGILRSEQDDWGAYRG